MTVLDLDQGVPHHRSFEFCEILPFDWFVVVVVVCLLAIPLEPLCPSLSLSHASADFLLPQY